MNIIWVVLAGVAVVMAITVASGLTEVNGDDGYDDEYWEEVDFDD